MASKFEKNPFADQDKFLISEQSGMLVLITGVIVALFIGLLVRAVISPQRVRELITRAAQNIHKDVEVQFEFAEVSLNNGILPRFAVVISGIRMTSEKECWMQPRLEVDEVRLPISIMDLLAGQGGLREVQADSVRLILRGEYKNCGSVLDAAKPEKSSDKKSLTSTSPMVSKFVSLQSSIENRSSRTSEDRIRSVSINNLSIELDKYPNYHAQFEDMNLKVKSYAPHWVVLNAKTQLFHNEQVGDYLSHANIHLEYNEALDPAVQAHFFGNWREGYYSLVGHYSPSDKDFVLETELKHIPFSQILSLMQRYRIADPSLNAKQLWLSFHSRYAGNVEHWGGAPLEVTNMSVDGDQIEIDADRINFQSLNPLRYDPIQLNIQRLNVDKILSFFSRSLSTKIFANMGSFSGRAEIRSGQDITLRGHHSGLEFIFSNKGQRELQTINNMSTEATFKNEEWKIHLSNVEPAQGSFSGDVQVVASKNFADTDVKLKVDEAILAPNVQMLMTQSGDIGSLNCELNFSTRAGIVSDLKGHFKIAHMKVEGVEMSATQGRMSFARNEVRLDAKVAALKLSANSYAMKIVSPVLNAQAELSPDGALEVLNINGLLTSRGFKNLQWKSLAGNFAKNGRISTEGLWDEQGKLDGSITVKSDTQQKWKIGGTRETPEFFTFTGHEGIRR